MELTGKCKSEFEKWYINNHCKDLTVPNLIKLELRLFNSTHDSMKYGVYQDYFGSVDIFTTVSYMDNLTITENYFYDVADVIGKSIMEGYGDSYLEVRCKSIKKANELRNEQLNNK